VELLQGNASITPQGDKLRIKIDGPTISSPKSSPIAEILVEGPWDSMSSPSSAPTSRPILKYWGPEDERPDVEPRLFPVRLIEPESVIETTG
jgi:hypothetical protein